MPCLKIHVKGPYIETKQRNRGKERAAKEKKDRKHVLRGNYGATTSKYIDRTFKVLKRNGRMLFYIRGNAMVTTHNADCSLAQKRGEYRKSLRRLENSTKAGKTFYYVMRITVINIVGWVNLGRANLS